MGVGHVVSVKYFLRQSDFASKITVVVAHVVKYVDRVVCRHHHQDAYIAHVHVLCCILRQVYV